MDFFTDLMGLILLIVCILIVLIFLKDYIRLGGKKTTVNKKQKMIVYEVHQNNKRIQQGWITDDQLPFQFGRNAGSGNDVVVVPEGTPADEAASVSRAWFYIQKDALGNYMVYSAELSGDGKKRQSEKKKLVVENGNTWKAMHTVKLQSEVRLKADQFQVMWRIPVSRKMEEYNDQETDKISKEMLGKEGSLCLCRPDADSLHSDL